MSLQVNPVSPPILSPRLRNHAISEIVLCSTGCSLNAFLISFLVWNIKVTVKRSNVILILNLAVWDFLFGAYMLSMAVKKMILEKIYKDQFDCQVEGVVSMVLGMNSFFAIVLLSTDRYITVVKRRLVGLQECCLGILIGVILASLTGASPLFFDLNVAYALQPSGFYCLLDFTRKNPNLMYSMYIPTVFYFACMLLVSINYYKIIQAIRVTRESLHNFVRKSSGITSNNSVLSSNSENRKSFIDTQSSRSTSTNPTTQKSQSPKNRPIMLESPSTEKKKVHFKSKSRNRALEIQLAKKTIYIGSTHIFVFLPFGLSTILQMAHVEEGMDTFDMVGVYSFFVVLILDPLWSLVLDQQIRQKINEQLEKTYKAYFSK